jgi:diguanylate cyclase (GGDEF)-like protein
MQENPIVGKLAHQIMHTLRGNASSGAPDGMDLIRKMLGVVAVAEQQIAEQKRRIDYLESLAMTDELTGLVNRRGFEDFLRRTLAAARRYDEVGVIAFVDLNDFKRINDRHGHAMGDKVLTEVAGVLTDNVRASDLVARVGGDEFVLLLVRCSLDDGRRHIESIGAAIEQNRIIHGRHDIRIGASIGIEPYGPDSDALILLNRADAAMYRCKRHRSIAAA